MTYVYIVDGQRYKFNVVQNKCWAGVAENVSSRGRQRLTQILVIEKRSQVEASSVTVAMKAINSSMMFGQNFKSTHIPRESLQLHP